MKKAYLYVQRALGKHSHVQSPQGMGRGSLGLQLTQGAASHRKTRDAETPSGVESSQRQGTLGRMVPEKPSHTQGVCSDAHRRTARVRGSLQLLVVFDKGRDGPSGGIDATK